MNKYLQKIAEKDDGSLKDEAQKELAETAVQEAKFGEGSRRKSRPSLARRVGRALIR